VAVNVVLLAPHNDDETLFASFTILRERPRVIVCLRSFKQSASWYPGGPIDWQEREAETAAAMAILGCDWEQWPYPDAHPEWATVRSRILDLDADLVIAPHPEEGGHEHHNKIGEIAGERVSVRFYKTYVDGTVRSSGTEVTPEPWMIPLKLRALACYESQMRSPATAHHFLGPIREYTA
jgi:LmbE family N-acetylglucosaminyl deacetylase